MLNNNVLSSLPSNIAKPDYGRSTVTPGIVHFGMGNFFRAHEAFYIDRCLSQENQRDWGIVGVELMDNDAMREKAAAYKRQDGLFSLTEVNSDGDASVRVVGSVIDYLHAPADPEAVIKLLSDPAIRIISMTITEGGYNIDENTGEFDLTHAGVKHDLANPATPQTVFGLVIEALRRRRDNGVGPFTILSCDNLRHNGTVAKKAFTGYAKAADAELAQWIEANVTFPNAMVDRITPAVNANAIKKINAGSGLEDELPLLTETFHDWVLEDKFCAGRPDLAAVGARMTDDVTGYEQVKVRMLNASHTMLACPAVLLGYEYVHEAMQDEELSALLENFLSKDVIPTLDAPADLDVQDYKRTVLSRFSNPAMADQLLRIAGDTNSKIQVFWTDTFERNLKAGNEVSRLAFGAAAWLEVLCGKNEKGATFDTFEPTLTEEQRALAKADDLAAGLTLSAFDPFRAHINDEFRNAVVEARQAIRTKGVKGAIPTKQTEK